MDFTEKPRQRPAERRRVSLQDYTERQFRVAPVAPRPVTRTVDSIAVASSQKIVRQAVDIVSPQPFARPAAPKLQQSKVLARRAAQPPALVQPEPMALPVQEFVTETPQRRSRLQMTLVGMALVVFAVGIFTSLDTVRTNHSAQQQVSALSKKTDSSTGETDDVAVPSETKPTTSSGTYQTAPDVPKRIVINKLGVDARVRPVGVTTSNALGTPSNIYDTGWYNASAKPGDSAGSGAMVIDGHVHGPTLPGVFMNIKKLSAGDMIQVTRGDNQVYSYRVVTSETLAADSVDMGKLLTPVQPGVAGLNLITCGGKFDAKTQHYEDRVIVYTVRI